MECAVAAMGTVAQGRCLMILHFEYDILVRSPLDILPCVRCGKNGDFAWAVKNDRGVEVLQLANLCGACVILNTLDWMLHGEQE